MLVNGWTPLSQNLFCIGRVRVGAMVNLFLYLSYDFLGTVCVLLPSIPVGLGVYAVRLGVGLSLRPNEAFATNNKRPTNPPTMGHRPDDTMISMGGSNG